MNINNSEKQMTINELANLITQRFNSVDKRFNDAEKQTDEKIEISFNKLATMMMGGFDRIESRLGNRIDDLEVRLVRIEQKIDNSHGNLNRSINWLTQRLNIVMRFLNEKFAVEFPK